jgi:2-oxoglutarate ferredoxin oxidoreductase subunit beta
MTKGQPSPTSPEGMVSKASPYGAQERPLNPLLMALGYDISFIARCFSGELRAMTTVFTQALRHSGFSFIQVLSPCVTFNNSYDHYREITRPLPEAHDPHDRLGAMRLAMEGVTQYLDIFYHDVDRPAYNERFEAVKTRAPETTLADIFESLKR